jgi:hypothetical protein
MLKTDYESRDRLISAALNVAQSEIYQRSRLPGPNDDAEADYLDDQLLSAARSFVEAHKDQTIPEEGPR